MRYKSLATLALLFGVQAHSQSNFEEYDIESEVNAVEGQITEKPATQLPSAPSGPAPRALPRKFRPSQARPASRLSRSVVDEEMREQEQIVERKLLDEGKVSIDRNVDRFPQPDPIFVKPPGPKQGGTLRVEHPRAAEGLMRINRDGSYQFKTPMKDKSQSGSFKLGAMTPPKVSTGAANLSYESMYGSDDIFSVELDYVWQPFRKFGALGLRLGSGFATATGEGFFATPRAGSVSRAQESYTLFIVPLSAFVEYRFEYMRSQWIVPFVAGGGTYYGLFELRDDGEGPTFAGSPAVGGGGGLLFSISRLDQAGAFTLSQEYGIADMWFVLEARAMQGLKEDLDFTNQSINAGISVDF